VDSLFGRGKLIAVKRKSCPPMIGGALPLRHTSDTSKPTLLLRRAQETKANSENREECRETTACFRYPITLSFRVQFTSTIDIATNWRFANFRLKLAESPRASQTLGRAAMSSKRNFVLVLAVGTLAISFAGCRNQSQQFGGTFQQPFQGYQQPYQQQLQFQNPNQFNQFNSGSSTQQPFGSGSSTQSFGSGSSTQSFGNGFSQSAGSSSRSALIPPPPTGSINIPSLTGNNTFGFNQNRGLLNTNTAAPTAANRSARFNSQNGWHPIDGSSSNLQSSPNTQPTGSTTLGSNSAPSSNSSFNRNTAPTSATSVLAQNTQSAANQGYGDSFVRSPDYSTTSINETKDGTRLPATDASAIRAPSQFYARASGQHSLTTRERSKTLLNRPTTCPRFSRSKTVAYLSPAIQSCKTKPLQPTILTATLAQPTGETAMSPVARFSSIHA